MNKKVDIKAITLAGILSAVYVVVTLFSVYNIIPLLSVFSLMIMPIFAAYYASIYSFKKVLLFNLTTMILCFIVGLADPLYSILYVIPTLIVGDLFGLFNKLKIKYYTTILLQTIAFSLTNIAALLLAEKFYEIQIIEVIISDKWVYENMSFTILFLLSGAEAIFSSMFIFEKLKSFNIIKVKEKSMPDYGYITIVSLFLLAILTYFISNNLYFLVITLILILMIPILNTFIKKIKHFNLVLLAYFIVTITINFALCIYELFYVIPLVALSPIFVYSLVKSIIYIYNINKLKKENRS